MLVDVKKEYNKLRKMYKLPKVEDLDYAFEIRGILCDSCIILREIRRKIEEVFESYIDMLAPLIQPDNIFIQLHEYKVFSETDRNRILTLFKKLMGFDREGICVMTDGSDKANAEFINTVYAEWGHIQKEMSFVASKLKDSWEKDVNLKQKLEYMG